MPNKFIKQISEILKVFKYSQTFIRFIVIINLGDSYESNHFFIIYLYIMHSVIFVIIIGYF